MALIKPGNFQGGPASNFTGSAANNRNRYGTGIILTSAQLNFGWQHLLFNETGIGTDAMAWFWQGYTMQFKGLGGISSEPPDPLIFVPDADFQITGIVPVTAVELNDGAGGPDVPLMGYFFNNVGAGTILYLPFLASGKWRLNVSWEGFRAAGNPDDGLGGVESGTVDCFAGSQLVASADASSPTGGSVDFDYASGSPFQLKMVVNNAGGDFSGIRWKYQTPQGSGGSPPTILDSGAGIPPFGYYWGVPGTNPAADTGSGGFFINNSPGILMSGLDSRNNDAALFPNFNLKFTATRVGN